MSEDITHVLEGWDFDPHELCVRIVNGADGKSKVQMRVELGLLQMELDGSPDGSKAQGFDSILERFEAEAASFGREYRLNAEALDELHREGQQYYQRYLCLFQLGDFARVVRDTDRNLRLFNFVKRHGRKRRDIWRFDQYRPYLLMMNGRAKASLALSSDDRAGAIEALDDSCAAIREFLAEYNRTAEADNCFELEFLSRWRDELAAGEPSSVFELPNMQSAEEREVKRLRSFLQKAVSREDYENAAMLRDQIRRMEEKAVAD